MTYEVDNIKIQSYEFQSLEKGKSKTSTDVKAFDIQEFSEDVQKSLETPQHVIRQERNSAKKNLFNIMPVVKDDRGIIKQEERDYEERVQNEVEKRLEILAKEAFDQGYQEGKEKGFADSIEDCKRDAAEKIDQLSEMLNELVAVKDDIVKNQKDEIYRMVKTLVKWICLREIEDDSYIQNLFERLVLEVQTKNNLLFKVNESNFARMPEVLEVIQQKIGELPKVRVEIEHKMEHPGLIIESENGIVDGSISAQFRHIDKLFESVGLYDKDE